MILGVCLKIIKQEIEPGVLFNVGVMVFCGSSECDVCKNSLRFIYNLCDTASL